MEKTSVEGRGGGALSLDTRMLAQGLRPLEVCPQNGVVTVFIEDQRQNSQASLRKREPARVTGTERSKGKSYGR